MLFWDMLNSLMCLEYFVFRKVVRDEIGNVFWGYFFLDGIGGWLECYLKLFCKYSLEFYGFSLYMVNFVWFVLWIIRSFVIYYFFLIIIGMYF